MWNLEEYQRIVELVVMVPVVPVQVCNLDKHGNFCNNNPS